MAGPLVAPPVHPGAGVAAAGPAPPALHPVAVLPGQSQPPNIPNPVTAQTYLDYKAFVHALRGTFAAAPNLVTAQDLVNAEANLSLLMDVVLPVPPAPAWWAPVQNQLNAIQAQQTAMQAQQAAMQAQIQDKFDVLEAQQDLFLIDLYNARARANNYQAFTHINVTTQLSPLKNEDGDLPAQAVPLVYFPGTTNLGLTVAQLDALADFYGTQFAGNTVAARTRAFQHFITQ